MLSRHAAEDKKRKEEIETRNQADNLVFQTRKQLKDLGTRCQRTSNRKSRLLTNALEEAVKGGNHSDIKAKMEALNNAWNEASTKMYEVCQRPAGRRPPSGQPGSWRPQQQQPEGEKGKKVEDADFEVVDDK